MSRGPERGLLPALAGILARLAGGVALSHFMRSVMHGVNVTEPPVHVAAALILVGVSLVADQRQEGLRQAC